MTPVLKRLLFWKRRKPEKTLDLFQDGLATGTQDLGGPYRGVVLVDELMATVKKIEPEKRRDLVGIDKDQVYINWPGIRKYCGALDEGDLKSLNYIFNFQKVKETLGWKTAQVYEDLSNWYHFKVVGYCRCGGVRTTTHDIRLKYTGMYQWFWGYVMPAIVSDPHNCFDPSNANWRWP